MTTGRNDGRMSVADKVVAIVIAIISLLLAGGFRHVLTPRAPPAGNFATNPRAEPLP
jgi:hypothetical protein